MNINVIIKKIGREDRVFTHLFTSRVYTAQTLFKIRNLGKGGTVDPNPSCSLINKNRIDISTT